MLLCSLLDSLTSSHNSRLPHVKLHTKRLGETYLKTKVLDLIIPDETLEKTRYHGASVRRRGLPWRVLLWLTSFGNADSRVALLVI